MNSHQERCKILYWEKIWSIDRYITEYENFRKIRNELHKSQKIWDINAIQEAKDRVIASKAKLAEEMFILYSQSWSHQQFEKTYYTEIVPKLWEDPWNNNSYSDRIASILDPVSLNKDEYIIPPLESNEATIMGLQIAQNISNELSKYVDGICLSWSLNRGAFYAPKTHLVSHNSKVWCHEELKNIWSDVDLLITYSDSDKLIEGIDHLCDFWLLEHEEKKRVRFFFHNLCPSGDADFFSLQSEKLGMKYSIKFFSSSMLENFLKPVSWQYPQHFTWYRSSEASKIKNNWWCKIINLIDGSNDISKEKSNITKGGCLSTVPSPHLRQDWSLYGGVITGYTIQYPLIFHDPDNKLLSIISANNKLLYSMWAQIDHYIPSLHQDNRCPPYYKKNLNLLHENSLLKCESLKTKEEVLNAISEGNEFILPWFKYFHNTFTKGSVGNMFTSLSDLPGMELLSNGYMKYHVENETLFKKEILIIYNILKEISDDYSFNSFHHFEHLHKLNQSDKTDLEILWLNSVKSMDSVWWWNCVDFALFSKKKLEEHGIKTSLIWTIPEKGKYTDTQIEWIKIRHINLLYKFEWHSFLIEPSWGVPYPIPLQGGIIAWNNTRLFMTKNINADQIHQYTIRPNNGEKYKNRILSLRSITSEECQQLNSRLMRLPRGLDLIMPANEKGKHYYISFNPKHRWKLLTNIEGIKKIFIPAQLTEKENNILANKTHIHNPKEYFDNFINFYYSLPEEFFIS